MMNGSMNNAQTTTGARFCEPLASRILLGLYVVVTAVCVSWQGWAMFERSHRPMLVGPDDSFDYVWLPAVFIGHNLDFGARLTHSGTVDSSALDRYLKQPRTPTGLLPNKYPPGWALGSAPFFLVAHVFAPKSATGFEPLYLIAVWTGQLLYAAGGLWLAARIVRELIPETPGSVAVLGTWLASPLAYYQTARVSMSHSQVFALTMAVFWLALRISKGNAGRRWWFALGFCCAMLVVTRNVTVVYLAFPAVLVCRNLRSWDAAVSIALGCIGPLCVQLVAWKMIYGSWIVYSYGSERFDFSQLNLPSVLFSPLHGWFYWHPILLVGIVSFLIWSARRTLSWPWVLSLVAIVLLNAAWPCWWFGSSFGNRGFESATFFAMVGLAALLGAARESAFLRRTMSAVLVLAIAGNLVLLALFLTKRIPREEAVTYGDMGRAAALWLDGRQTAK